jgi:hypothetical protein
MSRASILTLLMGIAGPVLAGCGSYYATSVNAAASRFEQARQLGAETQAPFEYYSARQHLQQARREGADGSDREATAEAETAETYAQRAIDTMQAAKKDGRTSDAK